MEKTKKKRKAASKKAIGPVSARSMKVYDAIAEYLMKNNYPPSMRELCEITGIRSTSSIYMHLFKLNKAGLLDSGGEFKPRTLRIPGIHYVDERDPGGMAWMPAVEVEKVGEVEEVKEAEETEEICGQMD